MAVALENFSDWLGDKLRALNTDDGVFGSYITGILDSDETPDEKTEALQGILSEIVENEGGIDEICGEILDMWLKFKQKEPPPSDGPVVDVDAKLAKLMESQCLQTTKTRQYTEEEKKIREAILSQYSQMTDDEDEEVETASGGDSMQKNTNAQVVAQAEKEKREYARVESQKKKEKDKEDREKQKQQREEKKEKRKTQKGERRR